LGALYGLVTHRLPGTPAIRGTIFVSIENTILYPALALERFHPARKAGEMGSYWAFRSWLWTMPRHIAYGTILAVCFDRLRNE